MANKINANFVGSGLLILTENVRGEMYWLSSENLQSLIDDWKGNCDFVPSNDAKVFFAAYRNMPVRKDKCTDFESLIRYLEHLEISAKGYTVNIKETLEMRVMVEAKSAEEAVELVRQRWKDSEYVLDSECFSGVDFEEVSEK